VRGHFGYTAAIAYYPWGEERPQSDGTLTPDATDKFATYFRDGFGQDYANARYYNSNLGRFWSPDPIGVKAVDSKNPTSWNLYAYVNGDPVNFKDPQGLFLPANPSNESDDSPPDFNVCMIYPYYPGCGSRNDSPVLSPAGFSYPKCNPNHDSATTAQLQFVASYYSAALAEAATIQSEMPTLANGTQEQANLSNLTDAFLDWSAWESHWGNSEYTLNGNYFGYGLPSSLSNQTSWGDELTYILGVVPSADRNPNYGKAPYSSFLVEALIASPNASPSQILQSIANAGYNASPNYGNAIAGPKGINVQPLIDCLEQYYAKFL
jgi:RHS repeat-associated protein